MAACACDRLWELFDSISVPCGHLERGAAAHGHWGWCQFQRPLETAWQGSGSPVTLPCAEVGVEWETDHTMGELSGGITGLAGSCHSPFWCAQLQPSSEDVSALWGREQSGEGTLLGQQG